MFLRETKVGQFTNKGVFAYVESIYYELNPPQAYYSRFVYPHDNDTNEGKGYIRFLNGSLSLYIHSSEPSDPDDVIAIPRASSAQYMKLMPDGHLQVFERQLEHWVVVADLLTDKNAGLCDNYPLSCGRNSVWLLSLPEESWHLLFVFEKGWEEGTLLDMVDEHSEDMQVHKTQVVEMMKLAAWCLQTNVKRRPSMSSVVKVLEGGMNVEPNLNYNFTDLRIQETQVGGQNDFTRMSSSLLSGPR
ncbi:putative non-specific serine/threonine protein kinase [Helianthus anomalus]